MGRKEFVRDSRGYVLTGDDRDIAVDFKLRTTLKEWCQHNSIDVQLQGSMSGIDVWRVKDEKHRVIFALKWS